MSSSTDRRREGSSPETTAQDHNGLLALALALATLLVFFQVLRFDFVAWDDNLYVTDNPVVKRGVTADGVRWSLQTHAANWYPLTLLSHMLDVQLFGLNPAGHHATSLVLHLVNTLLLFELLRRATSLAVPSAFVAALFALHPLHVESVAWISDRKGLLATTFGLLAIAAYTSWAASRKRLAYGACMLAFAASLASKPSFVTLPFALLLWDVWPLGRWRAGSSARGFMGASLRRVGEKLPLLLLAIVSSAVALATQQGARAATPSVSPLQRLTAALLGYVDYLERTVWPMDLSPLYPHPYMPSEGGIPPTGLEIAVACGVLLGLSGLAAALWRRPYVAVGWLWFLGILVPMIGLVQVGHQASADRYSYVPLIGLFIAFAWGGRDLWSGLRARRPALAPVVSIFGLAALVACMGLSFLQARHWRDSVSLFTYALRVSPRNPSIQYNLAHTYNSLGQKQEAMVHYRGVLAVNPAHSEAHNNLGNLLRAEGATEAAEAHYRAALAAHPDSLAAHYNYAELLEETGRPDEALARYEELLQLRPWLTRAHYRAALILEARGDLDAAIHHYGEALRHNPRNPNYRAALTAARERRGH